MNTARHTARTAGFIYLVVIITGMFSLAYVPHKLIDWNDSRTTFNNIAASTSLFRMGIYSSVICYVAFLFLPLLLYRLLRGVSESYARTMAILAVVSVPISLNNLQYKYAALALIIKNPHSQGMPMEDLQGKLMLNLQHYNDGMLLSMVFWGLWLFPFGVLVYRSGFIPKLWGILLMLGCIGYLINFSGKTLIENYSQIGPGAYIAILPAAAEIGMCAWLLFYGLQKTKDGK